MKLLASLAVLMAATIGTANASVLQYNTSGSNFTGAGFTTGSGTGTVTIVSGSDTATLSYNGPGPGPGTVSVNTPTNVSYGFIQLAFSGNTSDSISIPAFTFTLVINDITDSATASFTGTAAPSTIAANSSTLT